MTEKELKSITNQKKQNKMTKIKWTREKLEILSNEVRNSPDNLQNAFRKMSKALGVSPNTVSTIWYTKGRKL